MNAKKTKQNKKKDDDKFEIKWWDDWYNSDIIKKHDMVAKLLPVQQIAEIGKQKGLDAHMRTQITATIINAFFEDLRDYMYERIENERGTGKPIVQKVPNYIS